MADATSAQLYIRASNLRQMLESGNGKQIGDARDRLRAAMVEGYRAGYWRGKPEKLREYMQLLYRVDRIMADFAPALAMPNRRRSKAASSKIA